MTTAGIQLQARVDAQGPFRASLEQHTDVIDVSTAWGTQAPNLAWEFVDEAGHYHAWTKAHTLPTLDLHVEHVPCVLEHEDPDECGGEDKTTYACRLCGAAVEPPYVRDSSKQVLPGRSWWDAIIYGVHLEMGMRVSVAFSDAPTGRARWFGIARVVGQEVTTDGDGATYVTKLSGEGELGRKG